MLDKIFLSKMVDFCGKINHLDALINYLIEYK